MSSMSEIITDRRHNTALLAMRLAVSRSPAVAPWPSPHLSLGNKCSPFGNKECWEVTGPAEVISSDLFGAVRTLLGSRAEYLNEKEPKPCFIMYGLYMIGDDEAHANPTLLLSCERKVLRRKAMKLVRESGILAGRPGVRLAESVRPPLVLQPPVLLGSPESNPPQTFESPDSVAVYWSPSKSICGIPIYGRKFSSGGSFFYYQATIGGLVCYNDKTYGLSTAHSFCKDELDTAAPDDDSNFEFSFDDRNEDVEFDEVSVTSSSPEDYPIIEGFEFPTQAGQRIKFESIENCQRFGIVSHTSMDGGTFGLDWALIELDPSVTAVANMVPDELYMHRAGKHALYTKDIVKSGPANRKVIAITGFHGIVVGMMSKIPTFMMLPTSKSFEEVWTVKLELGSIGPGDCGSWVIDRETGDLYGYIFAGSPESSVAFIMPALHVKNEIKKLFGYDWTFPKTPPQIPQSNQDQSVATHETPTASYNEPALLQSAWSFAPYLPGSQVGQEEPKGISRLVQKTDTTPLTMPATPSSGAFGLSLGDIITVVLFAKQLYRKCRDAGGEFEEISREVRGLHTILRYLKYEVQKPDSSLNKDPLIWGRRLAPVIGDCDFTLRQLDNLIMKYERLSTDSRPRVLWNKLLHKKFEIDQLGGIKAKLISHKTSLTLFLDTVQLRQSGELETSLDGHGGQLDLILDKVDAIATRMSASNGAYSRLSYDDDGREVWNQFRRELVAEGFSRDVLNQHKDVLRAYIRQIDEMGLQADGESTDASSTVGSVFDDSPEPISNDGRRYSTDGDFDSNDASFAIKDRQLSGLVIETKELPAMGTSVPTETNQDEQNLLPASLADGDYDSKGSPSALSTTAKPMASIVAPDEYGNPIPADAKWTKIRRTLVSPQVLEEDHRRYEARPDFVAVLGVLSKKEIEDYAARSRLIREARRTRYSQRTPLPPNFQPSWTPRVTAAKERDRLTTGRAQVQGEGKRRWKENLTAASIGGAAVSLLSVLSEAAEGL